MTNVGRLAAMALILLVAASPASAQLKKNLRQANKHWDSGNVEAAVELYEKILDATQPGDGQRPDALYGLIMASLMSGSATGDGQHVRNLITEFLGFYPRHPNRLAVQAVRDLLDSTTAARKEAQRREEDLLRKKEGLEKKLAKIQEDSGENASLEAENKELAEKLEAAEKRLAAKSSELETTKQELAKQEDALQKLRQRLVGDSGG